MPFQFTPLKLPGLTLIEPRLFHDDRGYFTELFKRTEFEQAGIEGDFVQDNYSYSTRGVLRGLHYQHHPHAQAKLITVLRGEILDVAVDLRRGSPTYGEWYAAPLRESPRQLLFVPLGFAHGFYTFSDEAQVMYKVTAEYAPASEGGIVWNDPELAIDWPTNRPVLSPKDAALPLLGASQHAFKFDQGIRS